MRVLLMANYEKPAVVEALRTVRPWLEARARIVAEIDAGRDGPLEDVVNEGVDLVIVLGGDGTLLGQARRVVDLEAPIVGVNFGKLGFLAEFSREDLEREWHCIAGGACKISQRVMIEAKVFERGKQAAAFSSRAMNDCVITAGRPFRMIDLELSINPRPNGGGTIFGGDGVIIATPSGSTAYNASAGGPIIAPDVDALVVTPICPQSLAFRSIVTHGEDHIRVTLHEANAGTTLVIDGQESHPLTAGSRLHVTRHPRRLQLVTNPQTPYWRRLAKKMHWAASPRHA